MTLVRRCAPQFYLRIRKYYTLIVDVFDYYCTVGTGDSFSIQLNAFLEMCESAGIAGRHSLSSHELQSMFVVVNVEEGPRDNIVNKANLDRWASAHATSSRTHVCKRN